MNKDLRGKPISKYEVREVMDGKGADDLSMFATVNRLRFKDWIDFYNDVLLDRVGEDLISEVNLMKCAIDVMQEMLDEGVFKGIDEKCPPMDKDEE